MSTTPLDQLSETRRIILDTLQREGPATCSELSRRLGISPEGMRQQLHRLKGSGLVEDEAPDTPSSASRRGGRPASLYRLSKAAEQLFPRSYGELSVTLLDALSRTLGETALGTVLGACVEEKVRLWSPRLEGLDLRGRLAALQGLYLENDPFVEIRDEDAGPVLVERNCPFLQVALKRPALCSITVRSLERLLGMSVRREARFQWGDGCCRFRPLPEEPLREAAPRFAFEDEGDPHSSAAVTDDG